jgi:hypothetical protein
VVEGVARDERIVQKTGYSKKIMTIWKDPAVILQNDFYDTKGRHLKRFTAVKVELIDGRWTTTQMKMERIDGSHTTFFLWSGYEYNTGLSEDAFSSRRLGSGGVR